MMKGRGKTALLRLAQGALIGLGAVLPGVSGPGSLHGALPDGLWNLTPEQLCKYCEIEESL